MSNDSTESGPTPPRPRASNDPPSAVRKGWKLRFDAPPEETTPRAAEQAAEDGDILALFRAWAASRELHASETDPALEPSSPERRENSRYFPAETNAWIGWWRGPQFEVTYAEFVNLSHGGAHLVCNERPPTSQPVWICLGAPHPIDFVQCRVLDAAPVPEARAFRARLEFHTPCSHAFFIAAGQRAMAP